MENDILKNDLSNYKSKIFNNDEDPFNNIPILLKPYLKNIKYPDEFDVMEKMMIKKCKKVFKLIFEKKDVIALEWFYYNWINDLQNSDVNNIVEETMTDFINNKKPSEKEIIFIDFAINNYLDENKSNEKLIQKYLELIKK